MKKILVVLVLLGTFGCRFGQPIAQPDTEPNPERNAEVMAAERAQRLQHCLDVIIVINDAMDYIPYEGCFKQFERAQPSLPEVLIARQAIKHAKIKTVMLDWYGDVNYSRINGYIVSY
jgi:hypothetical protein